MGALTTAITDAPRSRVVASVGACQGCGACLLTCPEHAIRPRGGQLFVCADRCTGCGECVEVCPVDVIELVPSGGFDAARGGQP
jgi:ferredoxin